MRRSGKTTLARSLGSAEYLDCELPSVRDRDRRRAQVVRLSIPASRASSAVRVVHRAPGAIGSGFGMLEARGRRLRADFDPASLLAAARRRKR